MEIAKMKQKYNNKYFIVPVMHKFEFYLNVMTLFFVQFCNIDKLTVMGIHRKKKEIIF